MYVDIVFFPSRNENHPERWSLAINGKVVEHVLNAHVRDQLTDLSRRCNRESVPKVEITFSVQMITQVRSMPGERHSPSPLSDAFLLFAANTFREYIEHETTLFIPPPPPES